MVFIVVKSSCAIMVDNIIIFVYKTGGSVYIYAANYSFIVYLLPIACLRVV